MLFYLIGILYVDQKGLNRKERSISLGFFLKEMC